LNIARHFARWFPRWFPRGTMPGNEILAGALIDDARAILDAAYREKQKSRPNGGAA